MDMIKYARDKWPRFFKITDVEKVECFPYTTKTLRSKKCRKQIPEECFQMFRVWHIDRDKFLEWMGSKS